MYFCERRASLSRNWRKGPHMLVLGIILVLLAVGALVAALVGGANQSATFDLGAVDIQTNTFTVFLAGAATVVLLVAGLALISAGIRRAGRRRQERKKLNRLTEELETRDRQSAATEGASETGAETTATKVDQPVTEQDRPNP